VVFLAGSIFLDEDRSRYVVFLAGSIFLDWAAAGNAKAMINIAGSQIRVMWESRQWAV